ncbi:hypothetical protein HMPREF1500_2439 [Fusobacterium sp. CM22]|nr:hypothetical protein HMPREF1500_2439 [Fusobacterium sp. CM22]
MDQKFWNKIDSFGQNEEYDVYKEKMKKHLNISMQQKI